MSTVPTTVPVSGVWVRSTIKDGANSNIEVLVEIDEEWRLVIVESVDGPISHIVEPSGILSAPRDRTNDINDQPAR